MSVKSRVLIVDDEIDNLDALERLFRKRFQVLRAVSGTDALQILKSEPDVAVIVSDQRMPQMTGSEMLAKTIKSHPHTVRMLLTGYTDINSVIEAVNSGQIYRYLTKPWDSTDLTNAVEKAVERYNMARDLVLKTEALEKANRELQTLDQAKTQFMMLVNHELKTPLTSILSFLELLRETRLTDEQQQYLSRISASGSRLRELVEDVLLLLQAEMGTLKVQPKKLRLSEAVPHLTPSLLGEQQNKKIQLTNQLAPTYVQGDSVALAQVFNRLVHNAIKFSPAGAQIEILSESLGERERILVRNPGKIGRNIIEHITQPFFIDEKMMNHSKGVGLGLTISQALLRRMGTELSIHSDDGIVTMSFELPRL